MRLGRVGSKFGPRILLVLAAILGCAVAPAVATAAWPFYGHDLANSRNAGSAGPSRTQAGELQPLWSFTSTEGDFTGTPVVSDGIVVAGSNGGVVYALNAATGALLWSRTVGPQVNGSAAISGGVVLRPGQHRRKQRNRRAQRRGAEPPHRVAAVAGDHR